MSVCIFHQEHLLKKSNLCSADVNSQKGWLVFPYCPVNHIGSPQDLNWIFLILLIKCADLILLLCWKWVKVTETSVNKRSLIGDLAVFWRSVDKLDNVHTYTLHTCTLSSHASLCLTQTHNMHKHTYTVHYLSLTHPRMQKQTDIHAVCETSRASCCQTCCRRSCSDRTWHQRRHAPPSRAPQARCLGQTPGGTGCRRTGRCCAAGSREPSARSGCGSEPVRANTAVVGKKLTGSLLSVQWNPPSVQRHSWWKMTGETSPRWKKLKLMRGLPGDRTPWWERQVMKDHPDDRQMKRYFFDERSDDERSPWWQTFLMKDYPDEKTSWWKTTLMETFIWNTTLMKDIPMKYHHDGRHPDEISPWRKAPWWNITLMKDHPNERLRFPW